MEKGTYAGVRFSSATCRQIEQYIRVNNIQNPVPAEKLHTTVLYSRKYLPNYKAEGKYPIPFAGIPKEFDVWTSQDGKRCLVLKFSCRKLVNRHLDLMQEHGATYDYPQYIPHVTFSYDVGSQKDFPKYDSPLIIVSEYKEDLDLEWAKNNGGKEE